MTYLHIERLLLHVDDPYGTIIAYHIVFVEWGLQHGSAVHRIYEKRKNRNLARVQERLDWQI